MEGELDPTWQDIGQINTAISGMCQDGTQVKGTRETIWFDAANRLARFRRHYVIISPDGEQREHEYIQQKHPLSKIEVQTWLEKHGFAIKQVFGDRAGNPYHNAAEKAIFWGRKPG